ncbi:MAG: ATP-binding protein [Proteobacteria bacterium]|nr:ATP-binding protein [Pseudomonadota bacterium]
MNQILRTPPQPATPMKERRGVPASPPVRIAHVVSVAGSHAVAVLEHVAQGAVAAKDPRVQIGALVKIVTPNTAVMGIVSAMTMPMPGLDTEEEMGLIEINLAGEVVNDDNSKRLTFKRGVSQLPSIGDPVLFADRHDLTRVYAPPAIASIKVGTLFQDPSVPARLLTDDLLAKHFIVVGSTGSGKSCALTAILQRLLYEHSGAHVVILDVHNEYATAFEGMVERVTLSNFNLPFWLLNFTELAAALTSKDQHHDAEIEILSEAVVYAKRRYAEAAAGRVRKAAEPSHVISVDTPTPFRLSDVTAYIDDRLGKLERTHNTLPYRRLKTQIESLVADQRYNFMFGSLTIQDTMTDVLSRLFRIPNEGRPITVVDLSTAPPEILDVIISVISRLAFDLAVWSNGAVPMLLVCEEAHRYAPASDKDLTFVPTRRELGRIAKEGRKYSLSLALVTQRPSDLDPNILSQCGTAVALRLSSERDQQVIRANTYEGMIDLLDFLPLLGDREAIVLGQGVSMPMRIKFDQLGRTAVPKNMNSGFSKSWKSERLERAALDTIVTRWRSGGRE